MSDPRVVKITDLDALRDNLDTAAMMIADRAESSQESDLNTRMFVLAHMMAQQALCDASQAVLSRSYQMLGYVVLVGRQVSNMDAVLDALGLDITLFGREYDDAS